MKFKYLLPLTLFSCSVYAGEYSNSCFEGVSKSEAFSCLDKIETSSTQAVDDATKRIQELASENKFSFYPVSDRTKDRIDFAFDTYVKQQCQLIGSSLKGTGSGLEAQDCRIRLLKQREKDVKYLLSNHYEPNISKKTAKLDDSNFEAMIHGAWNCKIDESMDGGSLTISTEDSYIDNGRFNSFGTMTMNIDIESENISLKYSIAGTGTWDVKNGKLYQTLEDVKLVNLTAPEFDDVLNLSNMFPKNVSESSTITSIDKKSITVKSDIDGSEHTCSKKA